MKYKGIELKEVTEPQLFVQPKKMFVWDSDHECPTKANVCAIVNREGLRVITEVASWNHCAEIPEVPESKLVTYRELARWLAEGNGEFRFDGTRFSVFQYLTYQLDDADKPVLECYVVRKWDDTEWHKPTREYLGLEDK